MPSTSEACYLLRKNGLFLLQAGHPVAASFADALERQDSYSVLVDDGLVFYAGLELPGAAKKRIVPIVRNYLATLFPAEAVDTFAYAPLPGGVIAILYSDELSELFSEQEEFFARASHISTPFIELAARHDSFTYRTGGRVLAVDNGSIEELDEEPADVFTSSRITGDEPLSSLPVWPNVKARKTGLAAYRIPAAVLIAAYILFVAGGMLRLATVSKEVTAAESRLQEIYREAGVADSDDPYGILLYRAREGTGAAAGPALDRVLVELSNAATSDTRIDTLNMSGGTVRIEGTVSDFGAVDTLKAELEKRGAANVTIENTSRSDGAVRFAMRYAP